MISDRRRVERALVPGMLLAVVIEACGRNSDNLAVSYWIADLTQRGIIEVGDSPFTAAYEALLDGMDEHQVELAEMERSAERAAVRLRRFFEGEGYFCGERMREAA